MIRFAGNVIEVKKLFPKAEKSQRFVKVSMGPGSSMLAGGLGKAVEMLASKLHENWASSYRSGETAKGNENPTRMKDDGMGGQVDILNTSYAELPEKWQAENKAQAQSAIGLVAQNMDCFLLSFIINFCRIEITDSMEPLYFFLFLHTQNCLP